MMSCYMQLCFCTQTEQLLPLLVDGLMGGGKFLLAIISRHYRGVVCSSKLCLQGHLLRLMGFVGNASRTQQKILDFLVENFLT